MKNFSIVLILVLFELISFGQENMKTGIVYGKNHAFSLTAPDGWVLDNRSGVKQGLYAVFYREGESWTGAETVMYANTASLKNRAHRTIDQLIKYDLDDFKDSYPDIKITDGKDIPIDDSLFAKVKYLSGNSYGNYEAIAYIDAGKTGVVIVMSFPNQRGF